MSIRDIFDNKSTIDFRPIWRFTLPGSIVAAVLAGLIIVVIGFNLSIDFRGGGIYEVPVDASVTVADARAAISETDVRIQIVQSADGQSSVRVQTGAENLANSATILADLAELSGRSIDEISLNEVGPTWGQEITGKALRALVLFFLAVGIYLSLTLAWEMAVGALIGVIFDLVITAGVYAILRFEVSPATVVALLTIMGYSIYDVVVVFDKIKENLAQGETKTMSYAELVNTSVNQVMMRSFNAALTTVLPVFSMLVIGGLFLGGATLRDFGLALFIGLLTGTYSSLFLSVPFLIWIHTRMEARRGATAPAQTRAKRTMGGSGPTGLPR